MIPKAWDYMDYLGVDGLTESLKQDRASLFALILSLLPSHGFGANPICACRTDIVLRRLATEIANPLATF